MKRVLVLTVKLVGGVLALLVLACLLAAVLWETSGLPEWGANAIRAAAADQGISLRADAIKAGLVGGVVLDQAQVRLTRDDVPWTLTCQEVRLRPRLPELLRGEFQVQDVALRGAALTLGGGRAAPGAATAEPALRVERCNVLARRRNDGVLVLTVDGLAEKIAVHLEAEVSGLEALQLAGRPSGPGAPAATGSGAAAGTAPTSLQESLRRVASLLATARLSERDAFLSGRLALDLQRPEAATFDGEVGLTDLVLGEFAVRRFKSALHWRAEDVRLEGFRLILGSGETASGSLRLDLAAAEVSGTARARVLPETLTGLLPEPQPLWLSRLQARMPLDIAVELAPSPLAWERWQIRAEVGGRDLRLPGLDVRRLSAAGTWGPQGLTVDRWRAELDAAGEERAEGRLVWHRDDGTIEGEGLAQGNLVEHIRQATVPALVRAVRGIESRGPASLRLRLDRSPPAWRQLRASASLSLEDMKLRGRAVGPLALEAELGEGVVRLTRFSAGVADGPADALLLTLSADISTALSSGTWEVRFDLRSKALAEPADSRDAAPVSWTEAVALHGAVLFTPVSGAVAVTAEGTACPGRWYASYAPRLGLPESAIIGGIRCAPDAPARLAISAARTDLRQPLRLKVDVSADGPRYGELVFRTIQGSIEVQPRRIAFQGVRATTAGGDDLALDLQLDLEPLAVTIRNARITGNPDMVHAFIEDPDAKAIYRSVWKDFSWSPEHPAAIELRSLAYREGAGGRNWELTLDADLRAEQTAYRTLPLRRLDATVTLDLPEKVTVRTPHIETDTATVEGTVEILTGEDAKCTFTMHQIAGGQDPARILALINPSWGAVLGPLTFAPDTAVDCQGSFFLNRDPMLRLSGSLQGSSLQVRKLQITSPVANWGLDRGAIRWDLTSGRLCGGPMALTGLFDLETRRGTLAFRGDGMAMEQLAQQTGMKADGQISQGLLSAHCRLELLQGWAGRRLQVYGDGRLSLQQADLWRVPLFDRLTRVLDVTFISRITGGKASSLGRITRLDADLGFAGDRVVIRTLDTDGTIVSLRGQGQYCWENDGIYLAISGKALERAGIVGLIFRPLSWAFFNAELTGTAKDCKWRLSSALNSKDGPKEVELPPLEPLEPPGP